MGIMGGVFALSSVAGPILGGWLTEGIGWRWAFIFNLPLGLLALTSVITLLRLPKKTFEGRPELDYSGMALLAGTTTAFILTTTWGGTTYAWDSIQIIGLIITTIIGAILFAFNERRAKEPIMPLKLFKKKNFILATSASMLVSVAMFGAIGYMPTYFQMAVGVSASIAGLMMTPMMGAMLLTSITSGALVSKTGRYKLFPVFGTGILALGLALLSTVKVDTPVALICLYMAVIGTGLGMSMQILTLVVQNTFPHKMVGTATAANNYFRQVGSSFGAAVVGSIFATRLAELLAEKFPQGMGSAGSMDSLTPSLLASLPEAVRMPIVEAYNGALIPVFTYLVPLAILACVLLVFLREKALANKIEDDSSSVIEKQVGLASGSDDEKPRYKEKNA